MRENGSILEGLKISRQVNESSKKGKYHVYGMEFYDLGDSDVRGELYTDSPEKAIESWFKFAKKSPTETTINTKTKKDALALIDWASKNTDKITEWHSKYKNYYKLEYLLKYIDDKAKDGCKYFHEANPKYEWDDGDGIYPFCMG